MHCVFHCSNFRNCSWLKFQESDKFNLEKVVRKQRNWQWIYTVVYTLFVSVTQSGLARTSKTMYRWKDLSLLKLLLTNLLTSSESQMGPGRTVCICIVPYGSYTTLAALKGLSSVQTLGVFGQQSCSRLHGAKSLTMIKIEIHSVHFIQSIQSIDFTAGLA